jgi:hypothetical protein
LGTPLHMLNATGQNICKMASLFNNFARLHFWKEECMYLSRPG